MMTFANNHSFSPAYILHSRQYRDSSMILELFTKRDGRVPAILKSARRNGSGALQPFTPLLASYMGRGELKTISKIDAGNVHLIIGDQLFIGLYVNELLMKLLGKYEQSSQLFSAYQQILLVLVSRQNITIGLRRFELRLLKALGYGITFNVDAGDGSLIEPGASYQFVPDAGFYRTTGLGEAHVVGEHILALANDDYSHPSVAASAKKITHLALHRLLGGRSLKSREMYQQLRRRLAYPDT